jgi:MFS family permease
MAFAHDHHALEALQERNYRAFAGAFVCSSTGLQMMSAALLYELYERTGDVMMLGWAGVARALPVVLLALPAGAMIDSLPRHRVLTATMAGLGVAGGLLALASGMGLPPWVMLCIIFLAGLVRTFNGPSRASLLPDIVTPRAFANAVTWNTAAFQVSAIGGPLAAMYAITLLNPGREAALRAGEELAAPVCWPVYAATCVLCLLGAVQSLAIRPWRMQPRKAIDLASLRVGMGAGVAHMTRERVVLGAITLDLFAVLFAGVTGLLPVFVRDILQEGPEALGWLRAAPFVGALLMAGVLAMHPIRRRAGMWLLLSVAAFGVFTIVFGLSTSFWLSLGALLLAGAVDAVSVVVRHVIVPSRTPPELRGRVSSVNSVFIECSNELGSMQSAVVASWFGPVVSAVSGGVGALVVVGAIAVVFPMLRKLDSMQGQGTE